ncbi:protein-disulfide reductase DsbD domain-containing protein [Agromyces bauzanensis]
MRTDADRTGDDVRIILTVDLPRGVHIEPHVPAEPNLIPTVLEIDGLTDVAVEYPEPIVKDLDWRGLRLTVLEGSVRFVISGRARPGGDDVAATLRFQPCIGGACLPPRTVPLQAPLTGSSSYSVLDALTASVPMLAG